MKEAGGCAAGFRGKFYNFNADAEARLADALMAVGKFVQGESGCLLGHIKAAVVNEKGEGITLNLIDMDNGVEHHGALPRSDVVTFDFMCAVLDVDEDELTHKMLHAIDDSGIDYFIDKESLGHSHHHEEECDDPECDCHKHEDGKECDDPDCECHHHHEHHHHVHEDGKECDDPDCECHHHHHSFADMIDENGHFSHDHHHHDHDHDHDHEEHCCHCHDHDDHDHEHHDHDGHDEHKEEKKGFFSRLKKH